MPAARQPPLLLQDQRPVLRAAGPDRPREVRAGRPQRAARARRLRVLHRIPGRPQAAAGRRHGRRTHGLDAGDPAGRLRSAATAAAAAARADRAPSRQRQRRRGRGHGAAAGRQGNR